MIIKQMLLLFLLLMCISENVIALISLKRQPFLRPRFDKSPARFRASTTLYYKNKHDHYDHYEASQNFAFIKGLWKQFKKIIPTTQLKNKLQSDAHPKPEYESRYFLNLVQSDPAKKPHEVATLLRIFPDMSRSCAEEIVEDANVNGRSLIRAINCKNTAQELVTLLREAHPPIPVELFDTKALQQI